MGQDKIAAIRSAYPDLNLNWVLYGEGDMLNVPSVQSTTFSGDQINAASVVQSSFEGGEWLVKMYEDLRAKDQQTILELQKALYACEYRCKALEAELANYQRKEA